MSSQDNALHQEITQRIIFAQAKYKHPGSVQLTFLEGRAFYLKGKSQLILAFCRKIL